MPNVYAGFEYQLTHCYCLCEGIKYFGVLKYHSLKVICFPEVLHKCRVSLAVDKVKWAFLYKAQQIQPNAARLCVKSIIS